MSVIGGLNAMYVYTVDYLASIPTVQLAEPSYDYLSYVYVYV